VRAADHIRAAHPKAEVQVAILDLASVPSIQSFCDGLEMSSVDVLICNAGIVATAYDETEFGFERTVGVCHFGHFLLVKRLLPKLLAGRDSRVVMVASESHRTPKQLDFDNFPLTRSNFSIMTSYGQAKLCNVLMANELGRRYGAEGLTACSVHPGNLVTTEIGRGSFVMRLVMKLVSPFTKTPNQGAATTVLCATHPVASDLDGKYFNHCKPQRSSPEANDPGVAVRLWEISEQWVRIAS
jgi:WW domain-containing oxidoreductase